MDGSLFERGRALEDSFFREKDRQLVEELRQELSESESRVALAKASGIKDEAVLDSMLENNVTAESLTSISLVPLVAVAWADGVMDDNERAAILQAASNAGIEADSAGHSLLKSWLDDQPPEELLQSWRNYVGALKETLDASVFGQLKNVIMGRARDVAEAAGGILGFAKTSGKEAAVMESLEKEFG